MKNGWSGPHELGESHDEMEWSSQMVENRQGLGQFCEHGVRNLTKKG